MTQIPQSLQTILWSADVATMDINKNKDYIIHQILSHGTLNHITWLLHTYPKGEIIRVFLTLPFKDYRAARFYFIKTFVLSIRSALDVRRYVINTPRIIG